jgi:hypothetical protein
MTFSGFTTKAPKEGMVGDAGGWMERGRRGFLSLRDPTTR